MIQFHHVGVPTRVRRAKEQFIEGAGVHITNSLDHPYRFEFLRFDPASSMPSILQKNLHIAYMVDNLEAALKGAKVIVPPFDATPALRVAFILKDNTPVELMQQR